MSDGHMEPPVVRRGDIEQALKVAAPLRNVCELESDGDGETPYLVERGACPPEGDPRREEWELSEWRYELHVGCGDVCPVLAVVPYDYDADGPLHEVAESIAMAGEVIIGLVERVRAAEREAEAATNHAGITASRQGPLEEEAATLRVQHEADAKRIAELEAARDEMSALATDGGTLIAQMSKTIVDQRAHCDRLLADWDAARIAKDRATTEAVVLRAQVDTLRAKLAEAKELGLQRRPITDEVERHAAPAEDGLGAWLLLLDDGALWEECMLHVEAGEVIVDEVDDGGVMWARVTDAIPLDENHQPCPVGGWRE